MFEVTIDELIRSDKKLQDKITIKEEKKFEQFSDPGFYIGLILVLIGAVAMDNSLGDTFIVLGIILIVFFEDIVKSLKTVFKTE